jgi:LPS export ABC transporter protein LptC
MSPKTLFSILIIIILFSLSSWAYFASKNFLKTSGAYQEKKSSPQDEEVSIKDLVITETKDGEKFWEIYAVSGEYTSTVNEANLKNILGNFYKGGKIVMSVKSPNAFYNSSKKEIILTGGVTAANDKNVLITAQQICWTGSNDKITAKGNVKITKGKELLTTSNESVFDTDFTYLKISGNSSTYVYKN